MKKITRDKWNALIEKFIKQNRNELDSAYASLSLDHNAAYIQLKGSGGIDDLITQYKTNIEQHHTDKLITDESSVVYLANDDESAIRRMPVSGFERYCRDAGIDINTLENIEDPEKNKDVV